MGDWRAAAKTRASGGGEDVGMDEWQRDEGGVTRGKLHSSLCFTSLHSPLALQGISPQITWKRHPLYFWPFLLLLAALQANSACQIKQTTGLHNTVTLSPWLFFFSFKLFFGITIKGVTQTTRQKDGVKKRTLLRGDTLSGASMTGHKTKRFCSGGTLASDSSASLYQQQVSIFLLVRI